MACGRCCREVVVVDFETTGLSPDYERIIEVGAVRFCDGKPAESFDQLMNPGWRIPSFITELTGISNAMVRGKPTPEAVMPALKEFIGDRVVVAHNASFDAKFLHAEMARVRLTVDSPILCTLLLSRRLIPGLSSYKLEYVARHLCIESDVYHRALDDVLVTGKLWDHLYREVGTHVGREHPHYELFKTIMKKPKRSVPDYLRAQALKNSQV